MRQATIHLSNEELESLGMRDLVSVFRRAGLRRVSELRCGRPGCLLVVTAEEPVAEERLSANPDVEWWERIDGGADAAYLCKVAVPAFEEGVEPYHETDVSQGEIEATEGGVDVTIIGSHDALADRVREYEDAGADVVLRAMTDYEGPDDPLDATTARQREVLKTAFASGYFEVPREATTEEIGAELDLDPSTVREHLQRAQHNLLSELLSGARS